jgi:N,N'-diacetyllegionaminate synthase
VTVEIAGKKLGAEQPCLIIAEIGSNHGGDFDQARRLIRLAAEAGVDAVKFQSFSAEGLVVRHLYDEVGERRENPAYPVLKRLALPLDWHGPLKEEAERSGLIFLSTPFDDERLELLVELDVAALKIASGDLTHLEFIAKAAGSGKPIVLSTGMGRPEEIRRAVDCVYATGNEQLVLLHCVSQYPSRVEELNLRALSNCLGLDDFPDGVRPAPRPLLGLSDHSPGHEAALVARALGACVFEKHLTHDRKVDTPDAPFALEPQEFSELVRALRRIEAVLGSGEKLPSAAEREESKLARRSICAARAIARGEALSRDAVKLRRPGIGLEPAALNRLLGRKAKRDIVEDEILRTDWFE